MDIKVAGNAIELAGFLNERTDLDPLINAFKVAASEAKDGRVRVDFSGIERANSVGLLEYINLCERHGVRVDYINVPVWLAEQFALVEEFFEENECKVESVFARFYDVLHDKMLNQLLVVGKDIPILEDYSDFRISLTGPNGETLEPDFDPGFFFGFIANFVERYKKN